jgi:hypothetical protein
VNFSLLIGSKTAVDPTQPHPRTSSVRVVAVPIQIFLSIDVKRSANQELMVN